MSQTAFKFAGEDVINYDSYLGPILFEPASDQVLEYLGDKNAPAVLEIAAGTGRLTRKLATYFSDKTALTATDISQDMLEFAKDLLRNETIQWEVADAMNLPFPDNSFDLVICQFGIMFLPDKQKGISEVFRVLKPGGRFLFTTWDSSKNMVLINILLNETIVPFFDGEDTRRFQTPFSLFDKTILLGFLQQAGFVQNEITLLEFKSGHTNVERVVNGFFLKHSLVREVAVKDAAAVDIIAGQLNRKYTELAGDKELVFDLRAFVCVGKKTNPVLR